MEGYEGHSPREDAERERGTSIAIRHNLPATQEVWSKELVKAIAMDIGKETVAYVEVMYPDAIKAASSTFRLSLRNHIYNEIMSAIEVTNEGKVIARLADRKSFRRWWTAAYRKLRAKAAE